METKDPNFEITFRFKTYAEMSSFMREYDTVQDWRQAEQQKYEKKQEHKVKREWDLRGRHVKARHQKAREYQALFPSLPYRDCYRMGNL